MLDTSPLAPDCFPDLPPVAGLDMAVSEAGIRYEGRADLWVLRGQPGTEIAGVFTRNNAPGAPVIWSRRALTARVHRGAPRLIVVNSGTANVFCGRKGVQAVCETAQGLADVFGGTPESVLISSTGIIGEPLDPSRIIHKLPEMKRGMSDNLWEASARAIMTTDTYPKGATATADICGRTVTINGIAKGSGMIAPDMATMLAYIVTDAAIGQDALQTMLNEFNATSFNAITVDGDTSTSDTVLLVASGTVGYDKITDAADPALTDFKFALSSVMLDLAHQIVRDGEGASKFITVNVAGAVSDQSARAIAFSIANSPLIKTAIAGEDANWGRIVMAVGKAGEPVDQDLLTIKIGPYILAANGALSESCTGAGVEAYMKNAGIELFCDMGLGKGCFTV
ncbi:MAG: bifunctional glutamate N-acetyltransferase/amino-acid acetyltransferase ArgJ, partial [Hyphomonadaceae bacterium]|nr:bifunctional glutamate N-acetyltransferase/amino-acid acetyltransferase ArgJ [Hyphomonadaceae bacterium]